MFGLGSQPRRNSIRLASGLAVVVLYLALPASPASAQTADTVLFNGQILTVDKDFSIEQALANLGSALIPGELRSTLSAKSALTYPDGLTAREVEVLRLVAQGLTDAHIAEQLVISPRTVNGHLRSIYNKINVTSRSAATRYAVDQNLV